MEKLQALISSTNDIIWSYLLVGVLIICAVWFTVRSGFLQFRSVPEMLRLLTERRSKDSGKDGKRSISSFQAFAVSIASRVGTGNLAGVATAIVVGGPGAVFWMWIMALFGSASAFVESTLAQLYKRPAKDGTFIGGPAYYMERGIGKRWMGVLFAVLISITFGFAFNSVQSNTICASWELAFNVPARWMGIILTALTLVIIFGGIRRIAGVSSLLVPVMALLYIALALVIIAMNIGEIPKVLGLIVSDAFGFGDGNGGGWRELAGGGIGATIMQGVKRGMFSNEAGMGSAPNVAATADTTHPVKQGLIQALGVFTDTLVICSCTAFIILIGGVSDASVDGIQLTQTALTAQIGPVGEIFIALTILMFAFQQRDRQLLLRRGQYPLHHEEKMGTELLPHPRGRDGALRSPHHPRLSVGLSRPDHGADGPVQPYRHHDTLPPGLQAAQRLPQSEESRHQEPRIQKRKLARNSGQARMLVNRYVSPGRYSAADFRRSAFSAMVSWSMTSWMSPSMKTGRLYIV